MKNFQVTLPPPQSQQGPKKGRIRKNSYIVTAQGPKMPKELGKTRLSCDTEMD